jgi:hypothetical protein
MECPHCEWPDSRERREHTELGYRRFRCRTCQQEFNERTGSRFNHRQYRTDVVCLVVLWRARYKNNHLQHKGIKQRKRPMGGFKSVESATRFCQAHDEVRNFLRPRSHRNEVVSLAQRRLLYTARTRVLLTSLAAAYMRRRKVADHFTACWSES